MQILLISMLDKNKLANLQAKEQYLPTPDIISHQDTFSSLAETGQLSINVVRKLRNVLFFLSFFFCKLCYFSHLCPRLRRLDSHTCFWLTPHTALMLKQVSHSRALDSEILIALQVGKFQSSLKILNNKLTCLLQK